MTVLVTGATGHVGANLVRALIARGETVRVSMRSGASTRALDGLEVERVTADLSDARSLRAAVDGVEKLYHTAAMISIRSGDKEALRKVNVDGTTALYRAAQDAGVKKIVHTSSLGAVGTRPGRPSTEDDFVLPSEEVNDYERSKADSEDAVRDLAENGLEVTIVNPSAIVGPYDFRPSLLGGTLLEAARGKLKAYIHGAFDWVPMRDVVSGHLLAMEHGKRGERYILSGEVHPVSQILDWTAEFSGGARPRIAIPTPIMLGVALVQDPILARFFPHVSPRFNRHSIRLLTSGKSASNEKAQRQLGLVPSQVKDAVAAQMAWFKDEGLY